MTRFHEVWCPGCGDFSVQGPLAAAAGFFGVSRRTLQNWRNPWWAAHDVAAPVTA